MLKTKKLLEAITLMSDLFKYEDKVQSEFKLNISEAQPSFAAGRLFELLYDELLTDRGLTIVDDFLFSGDSYIPGERLIAIFPNSNKKDAQSSYKRLLDLSKEYIICPGHGK